MKLDQTFSRLRFRATHARRTGLATQETTWMALRATPCAILLPEAPSYEKSDKAKFEVLLAMAYLMNDRAAAFRTAFPLYDQARHQSGSGSFWIERR